MTSALLAVAALAGGSAPAAAPGPSPRPVRSVEAETAGSPPPSAARLAFVDEALAPSPARAAAPPPVNPVYQALRRAADEHRARWEGLPQTVVPVGPALGPGAGGERVRQLRLRLGLGGGQTFDPALERTLRRYQQAHGLQPTGRADADTIAALNSGEAPYERLIAANLIRARALPPIAGRRFILVNVAAGRLWLFEDGRTRGSMRVVVGKPDQQTPMMAGLIRYAVFNPYWNVPEDLVRDSLAPKVVRDGPGYFAAKHMQALSDWSDDATELDPARIDWAAVAAGRTNLRVRQRPGADNMMGAVKFMLPNPLGIYLHDTPDRALFLRQPRLFSSGCVRLEQASALARWLFGARGEAAARGGPDHRLELDEPVPVYITYLTVAPGQGGLAFYPDVYGRDPRLLAELGGPGDSPGAAPIRQAAR